MSEIYMMVTICNRKQMQKFVKFYKQNHVDTGNISLAMGTAASDVLDYFGLEEDEKGIHFCLVTRPTWKTVEGFLRAVCSDRSGGCRRGQHTRDSFS